MAASVKVCEVSHLCQVGMQPNASEGTLNCVLTKKTRGPKGRATCYVSIGSKNIYVIEAQHLQMCLALPDPVLDTCIVRTGDQLVLLCATEGGKVYTSVLPKVRRKQKKNQQISSAATNEAIFSSLLTTADSDTLPTLESVINTVSLTDHNSVLHEKGLCNILAIGPFFITLTQLRAGWMVSVYKLLDIISAYLQETQSTSKNAIDRTPLHTLYIPGQSRNKAFDLAPGTLLTNSLTTGLYGLLPHCADGVIPTQNQNVFVLDSYLYNLLFGMDANVLDTPGALVTLPGGQVHVLLLKPVSGSDASILGSQPTRLLYHLTETAVSVQGVCMVTEKQTNQSEWAIAQKVDKKGSHVTCDALLLIGQEGHTVLMSRGSGGGLDSREFSIARPVLCADVWGNLLFHSTGRDVYWTDLTAACTDEVRSRYLDCRPCGLNDVVGMTILKRETQPTGSTNPQLGMQGVMVSSCGFFMNVKVNVSPGTTAKSCAVGGVHMKDLLTSMQKISFVLAHINEKLALQNNMLTQLSIASLAVRGNQVCDTESSKPLPISCTVRVKCDNMGTRSRYTLIVRVINMGSTALSQDWTFCVSVHKEPRVDNASNTWSKTLSECLHPLTEGAFQEIHLPLDASIMEQLPVLVQPALMLCCTDRKSVAVLVANTQQQNDKFDSSHNIVIPLNDHRLDLLHFLHLSDHGGMGSLPSTSKGSHTSTSLLSSTDKIMALAEARPAYELRIGGSTEKTQSPQQQNRSALIHITRETAVSFILEHSGNKGYKDSDTPKLEVSMLQHLLKDNIGDTAIHSPHVKASTPHGHQVAVTVQRAQSDSDELDILLHSNHLQTLYDVRIAMLKRLQNNSKMSAMKSVSALEIRKTLLQLEDLKKEADMLQDSILNGDQSEASLTKQACSLYEHLRKLHLTTVLAV